MGRERILWLSVVVIFISSVCNYIYYQSKQLDEPIFMKHYYMLPYYEEYERTFELYYLVSKQNPVTVTGIELDDNLYASVSNYNNYSFGWHGEYDLSYVQEFNHHLLKAISVTIWNDDIEVTNGDSWSFQEMTVTFSNGERQRVNIGEIGLSRMDDSENKDLDFKMNGSSNQHIDTDIFQVKEQISITDITNPYAETLSGKFEMKLQTDSEQIKKIVDSINRHQPETDHYSANTWNDVPGVTINKSTLPIPLEVDQYVRLITKIDQEQSPSYIQLPLKLVSESVTGEEYEHYLFIHDSPFWNEKKIHEYIQTQKVGEHR